MIPRQHLLDSALAEIERIRFLATKIPQDQLEYRPSEGQRSTLELLQYLSLCGDSLFASLVVSEEERPALREKQMAEAKAVTIENFDRAMENQGTRLAEALASVTDERLSEMVTLPWGEACTLGEAFLNAAIKFLTAYRMQLFLYLKGMGVPELSTLQAWLAVDTMEEMEAKFAAS